MVREESLGPFVWEAEVCGAGLARARRAQLGAQGERTLRRVLSAWHAPKNQAY